MSKDISAMKKLLGDAISFFDVKRLSKVDLITEGESVVYVDSLGNSIKSLPTDLGHNTYNIISEENKFVQEIHFQTGSPKQDINGITNESLIATLIHRLTRQNESFPSPYNVMAILMLQGAQSLLHARVEDRTKFGIFDTTNVDPSDPDDVTLSRSMSIINSLGILSDVIFKFDLAYMLADGDKVDSMIDNIIDRLQSDAGKELNLASAFSFMSSAVVGTGVVRGYVNIAREFAKLMKKDVPGDEQ